jgi:hypothetical protein
MRFSDMPFFLKFFFIFWGIPLLGTMPVSCSSLPFYIPITKGWSSARPLRNSIRLHSVTVDRDSGWESVERELAGLFPLVLLEYGYGVSFEAGADYVAALYAVEREYLSGWRTERSVLVEVRLWREGEDPEKTPPLAAGRSSAGGTATLASSRDLNRLLEAALRSAAASLPRG